MPKSITPLTDTQCKKLKAAANGTTQLSDGGGLSLQVDKKGGKYWRFRYYRPQDKKRDEIRFGTYPEISLKEARAKREAAKVLLQQGIDPKQHQQEHTQQQQAQQENTFETIARQWHTDRANQPDKWTPDHAHRVIRSLELHIFPKLRGKPIDEIMPLEILSLLKAIEYAGKIDTAHKVYDVVNQVFSYAVRLRLCLFNPAAELRTELAQVKQTAFPHITDPQDIAQLLRKIDGYGGTPQVRTLLKISPYVFTRPTELRTMKWTELDFQAALWRKNGADMKNGIDHIIPLSQQVIALLESMKPFTGHYDYVFYNRTTGKPLSEAAASKAMHRLGYKGIATPHGFRHMASTLLNEMDYNGDWIERQLAHKDKNSTRETYNQAQYLKQRTQMLQEWANYLDQLKQQD